MKKIVALLLAVMLIASLAACGSSTQAPASDTPAADEAPAEEKDIPVIGISQYGEHPSLDNCREGFLLGLAEAGLTEGEDFTYIYENAGFDDNIAIQIAQNFSANNVALMCGIATNSATACFAAAEDKDIPVIFNAITDPVLAKLDSGNITGVSDKLPVEAQLDLIRKCQPDATTIGIIYTTSEPNSVSTIAEYKEKAGDYGFEIIDIGVTAQAEVTQAADTLISKKVDCISNLTDNNVVGVLDSILDKTNEAGIPVYGSEIEQVKKGCVASAGIDYIELGKQAGKLAAKVLTGEATCEELPYETISEYGIYVNYEALALMNIELPTDVAEKAIDANAE